jgi:nucleotide-binding universal stress UspA family protein
MFKKILHANDGSANAFDALSLALNLANENGSELHMVSVEEVPYLPETIEEVREDAGVDARRFHAVIDRARGSRSPRRGVAYTRLSRSSGERHCQFGRRLKADLLVVGASGHSALYDRMIGSRADCLVHPSPCPVLVVRPVASAH